MSSIWSFSSVGTCSVRAAWFVRNKRKRLCLLSGEKFDDWKIFCSLGNLVSLKDINEIAVFIKFTRVKSDVRMFSQHSLFRNRVSSLVEADNKDGGEAGGMAMGVTNYPERRSSTGAVSGHERPPDQVRAERRSGDSRVMTVSAASSILTNQNISWIILTNQNTSWLVETSNGGGQASSSPTPTPVWAILLAWSDSGDSDDEDLSSPTPRATPGPASSTPQPDTLASRGPCPTSFTVSRDCPTITMESCSIIIYKNINQVHGFWTSILYSLLYNLKIFVLKCILIYFESFGKLKFELKLSTIAKWQYCFGRFHLNRCLIPQSDSLHLYW